MDIKQVSVFIENKSGRLAEVTRALAAGQVDIKALSLADSSDFGVLRLIVDDPGRGLTVLKEAGFVSQVTDVVAAEIEDKPGGLARVLAVLETARIDVEYMYAFVEKRKDNAIVIFRFADPGRARAALTAAGVPVLDSAALGEL